MENAKKCVELTQDESEAFSRLVLPEPQTGECIYNHFATTGIRVDRVEPGFVVCTLKVPPRLTDRAGNLANGAIANLVDLVGASVVYVKHLPMNVSVDVSISYMSKAKLGDELEITSKRLGQRGRYSGTSVLLKNKATGEIIAQGRHSLFRSAASKLIEVEIWQMVQLQTLLICLALPSFSFRVYLSIFLGTSQSPISQQPSFMMNWI